MTDAGYSRIAALLRPERRVRRSLPPQLAADEARLFAGELERVLQPSALYELTNVRVSTEGLLFRGPRILRESFAFPFLAAQLKAKTRARLVCVNFALRRRRQLNQGGVWITDTWSEGYFHWIADALSRLYMILDKLPSFKLILPGKYAEIEFVTASLTAFGVTDIDFVGDDEFVLCRNLLLPNHAAPSGQYDAEVIRGVREVLLRRYGATGSGAESSRVYISRGLARKRRIVNEADVIAALRARHFHVVHTETMPLAEQVRLFSTASFVIGNHGAGLTNMLFMPADGRVLELRHHADAVNNCYFTLAATLGLQYLFQGCVPVRDGEDPHAADVTVDVEKLERSVDAALTA